MVDRWFFGITLSLSIEEFRRLPTNPAYKYEYIAGKALLTPRPRECHALLDLRDQEEAPVSPAETETETETETEEPVRIRRLEAADWGVLHQLFAGAFHRVQPFASLDDAQRLEAARQCLGYTRAGNDGPLIEPACLVAVKEEDDQLCGAILVTLMPEVDLSTSFDLRWKEPPPSDWAQRRVGRPHLTWIFVGPWSREQGLGTALLAAATRALREMGYPTLASTFLVGNDASVHWHWRRGFQLAGRPYSRRNLPNRPRR
jgi:ribosomal protein S18 acetylase RimI-like enzyme